MNPGLLGFPGGLPLLGGPPIGMRWLTSGTSFRKTAGAKRFLVIGYGGGQGGQSTGSNVGANGGRLVAICNVENEDVIPYTIGSGGGASLGAGSSTTMGLNARLFRAAGGASGATNFANERILNSDFGLLTDLSSLSGGTGYGKGGPNALCSSGGPGGNGCLWIWEFA